MNEGSMWWGGWGEINAMRTKCASEAAPPVWFCAIRHTGGDIVIKKTRLLHEAQQALGSGSSGQQQAIIPMSGQEVFAGDTTSLGGDPHTLDKTWNEGSMNEGSMWWGGWGEINAMRTKCASEAAPPVWFCAIRHTGGDIVIKKTRL